MSRRLRLLVSGWKAALAVELVLAGSASYRSHSISRVCVYVVCMLCVCCVYVVCMLCVCCVYVVCMLCVCCVYVCMCVIYFVFMFV